MRKKLREFGLTEVFHVTHLDNLQSIAGEGILSKNQLERAGIKYHDISLRSAQEQRAGTRICCQSDDGRQVDRSVHDMVPLFIAPKNPMTYKRHGIASELCLLVVDTLALCSYGREIVFTTGNMASRASSVYMDFDRLSELPWDVLRADYWPPDGRRERAAEFLVHPKIELHCVSRIEVTSSRARSIAISALTGQFHAHRIKVDRRHFFL